jgi:hypothetical protein
MSESCPSDGPESTNASSSSNKQQIAVESPATTTSPSRGLDEERPSQCTEIISAQRLLSSSSSIDEEITAAEQEPNVAFSQANGHPTAMDSPSRHRESQPLLGRAELDITFNNFPGEIHLSLFALDCVDFDVNGRRPGFPT